MIKKTRKSGPHNYPSARKSTKGVTKYEIYEQWRTRLQESGYTLSEKLTEAEFNLRYSRGSAKEGVGAKNITRSIARMDITVTKTGMKKIMKDLLTGRDLTFAEFYDTTTGEVDFQGLSKKELYALFKSRAEAHGWKRGIGNPEEWEAAFYRGRGLY